MQETAEQQQKPSEESPNTGPGSGPGAGTGSVGAATMPHPALSSGKYMFPHNTLTGKIQYANFIWQSKMKG